MTTFKEWVMKQIEDGMFTAAEVAEHGCVSGFAGLTYYRETNDLFDKYENEVWDSLVDSAEECGMTVPEFLGTIKSTMGTLDSLKNDVVWLAVEKVCQELVSLQENAA
jgi:hypothetical protein